MLPKSRRRLASGSLVRKAAERWLPRTPQLLYLRLVSHWRNPGEIVHRLPRACDKCSTRRGPPARRVHRHMSCLDHPHVPSGRHPGQGRSSEHGGSLEARCRCSIIGSWSSRRDLPIAHKIADGKGKAILRSLPYKFVPQRSSTAEDGLRFRWRNGSAAPCAIGPSRCSRRILASQEQGYLDAGRAGTWTPSRSTKGLQLPLWTLLMFQSWLDAWA